MGISLHAFINAAAVCAISGTLISCSTDTPPVMNLISSLPSPDGRWEARLEDGTYQIAPIGGANTTFELHIVPTGAPIRYVDNDPSLAVAHWDPPWSDQASKYFVLSWKDSSHLIVQCSRWDDTNDAKRQISDISIEYRKMPPTK